MITQPTICEECGRAGHASNGCDQRRARLAREAEQRRAQADHDQAVSAGATCQ